MKDPKKKTPKLRGNLHSMNIPMAEDEGINLGEAENWTELSFKLCLQRRKVFRSILM